MIRDLVPFVVLVDCHRAVGVDVFQELYIVYPLFMKRGEYCLSLH